MRRSARLRSVMSRSTRIVPRFDASGLSSGDRLTATGIVCPRWVRTTVSPTPASRPALVERLRGAPAQQFRRRSCPGVRRPNSRTTPTPRRSPNARGHSATSRARHRSCCSARRRESRARSSWTPAPGACFRVSARWRRLRARHSSGPARSARPGRFVAHWPWRAESARSMREIRLRVTSPATIVRAKPRPRISERRCTSVLASSSCNSSLAAATAG